MTDDVTVDFREGYGEGMSEAIRMLREVAANTRYIPVDDFGGMLTKVLDIAQLKVDDWRNRPVNL